MKLVDLYVRQHCGWIVCIGPVIIDEKNVQQSVRNFIRKSNLNNTGKAYKHRIEEVLEVKSYPNYLVSPLDTMLKFNKLESMSKGYPACIQTISMEGQLI